MTPRSETPTQSELAAAASDLRMATFRLARRLRQERAVDTMSDGQFAVLAALKINGPHTLTELAERENVTAPSMNRTVNCLADSGWLSRTADESDRRKVILTATDAGRAVVDETLRRRNAWLEHALEGLSPDQLAVIARAADLMREVAGR